MTIAAKELSRFWAKVAKGGPNDCWPWIGAKSGTGYGIGRLDSRYVPAHRVSFTIHNGEIPVGMYVCHHCDNPPCVNPAHLFAGTAKENMRDCVRKGRFHGKRPRKLTPDQEREIATSFANGANGAELGRRFGVGRHTVYKIFMRQRQHQEAA